MDEYFENEKDRRDFARFSVDLHLQFLDPVNNIKGEAQTKDISAKGIGIFTKENLPPQTDIEMWITVPKREEPLYVKGKVVWTQATEDNKYRIGINLDHIDLVGVSHILKSIYGQDWL